MLDIIKKIKLIFSYGPELEEVLEEIRQTNYVLEKEKTKDYLNLCARHQQRMPGCTYAEHNCDYCNLQKLVKLP